MIEDRYSENEGGEGGLPVNISAEDKATLDKIKDAEYESRKYYFKLRKEEDIDDDYRFNDAWDENTRNLLEKQQGIPALSINVLGACLNWLSGYQTMNRYDIGLMGTEGGDTFTADVMGDCVKHVMTRNHGDYLVDDMFDEGTGIGCSYIEGLIDYSEDIRFGKIKLRPLLSREVCVAPEFRLYDTTDARYLLISRKLGREQILEAFSEVPESLIDTAIQSYDEKDENREDISGDPDKSIMESDWGKRDPWVDEPLEDPRKPRKRFRVVTYWHWKTERKYWLIAADGNMTEHKAKPKPKDVGEGERVVPQAIKIPYFAVKMGNVLLVKPTESPFYPKYLYWPIAPFFAQFNRTARTSDKKHRSVTRDGRDPEYEINLKTTQGMNLLIAAANPWRRYPKGSLTPAQVENWRLHGHKPNFQLEYEPVAKGDKPEVVYPISAGREFLAVARDQSDWLKQVLLINPDLMSLDNKQDESGRALMIRERQGQIGVARYFNHLRWTKEILTNLIIGLILNSFTPEKILRVVGEEKFVNEQDRLIDEAAKENKIDAYEPQTPVQMAQAILDNYKMTEYDVKVAEVSSTPTNRMAQAEMLANHVEKFPFLAPIVLPYILEDGGHPKGAEIASKLKEVLEAEKAAGTPPEQVRPQPAQPGGMI